MIFKTEKDREIAYRNIFSTIEGRMVLVDILDGLHFWDISKSPNRTDVEMNILNLCSKNILNLANFWHPKNIVGNMLTPKKKKKRWWNQTVGEFTERKRK